MYSWALCACAFISVCLALYDLLGLPACALLVRLSSAFRQGTFACVALAIAFRFALMANNRSKLGAELPLSPCEPQGPVPDNIASRENSGSAPTGMRRRARPPEEVFDDSMMTLGKTTKSHVAERISCEATTAEDGAEDVAVKSDVSGLRNSMDNQSMEACVRKMLASGARPTKETFSLLIELFMQVPSRQNASRVLHWLEHIDLEGIVLDLRDFRVLVHVHTEVNDLHGAIAVLDRMEAAGLDSDTHAHVLVLEACAQCVGCRDMAAQVFDRMRIRGLQPDVAAYTAFARSFSGTGDYSEVERLRCEMRCQGIQVDRNFLSELLCSYANAQPKQTERAKAQFRAEALHCATQGSEKRVLKVLAACVGTEEARELSPLLFESKQWWRSRMEALVVSAEAGLAEGGAVASGCQTGETGRSALSAAAMPFIMPEPRREDSCDGLVPDLLQAPPGVWGESSADLQIGLGKRQRRDAKFQCHFMIGIEEDPDFRVVGRIIGPGGAFVKAIALETGAKLRLRGRGTNFLEGSEQKVSTDDLMLCISAPGPEQLVVTSQRVWVLLERLYAEYDAHLVARQQRPLGLQVHMINGPRKRAR